MTAQKPERLGGPMGSRTRKPWRKKSPVEVVLEQTEVLRTQIATREQELKDMKRQLQKFEEAKKIFETV
jgi:hypothetical protein